MTAEEERLRMIIREAVTETLSGLGFDVKNQNETQADILYLRKIRKGSEEVARVARSSAITVSLSTMLYLLWQAVKEGVR